MLNATEPEDENAAEPSSSRAEKASSTSENHTKKILRRDKSEKSMLINEITESPKKSSSLTEESSSVVAPTKSKEILSDPYISSQASNSVERSTTEDQESFSMLYYFSAVMFVVLTAFAVFLYRYLFKSNTPPPRAGATALPLSSTPYSKLPQSDLGGKGFDGENSLVHAANDMESDWEEWDTDAERGERRPSVPRSLGTV